MQVYSCWDWLLFQPLLLGCQSCPNWNEHLVPKKGDGKPSPMFQCSNVDNAEGANAATMNVAERISTTDDHGKLVSVSLPKTLTIQLVVVIFLTENKG